jgi:hypothetical protein
MAESANKKAPPGKVYVCACCGKRSPWLFGFDDKDLRVGDKGWDVSCMMNAVLEDLKD